MPTERAFLIVLIPIALMVSLDMRGWLRWIFGEKDFEGTRIFAAVPLEALMICLLSIPLPLALLAALLAFGGNVYTSSMWFATHVATDYTEPGFWFCLSMTACLALCVTRRGVVIKRSASKILFYREFGDAFSLHFSPLKTIHRSPPFRRTAKGAPRELARAVEYSLTPATLAALEAAGARSLTVASTWLHSKRRISDVLGHLESLCPTGKLEMLSAPLGWYETAYIRFMQVLLKCSGMDAARIGRGTMARFWISAAEKDTKLYKNQPRLVRMGRFFHRVRTPGVRLTLPQINQTGKVRMRSINA